MALNVFKVSQMVSKVAAISLFNELGIAKRFKRQLAKEFQAKVGTTVNAKKYIRYIPSDGPALSIQSINEDLIPVTIEKDRHIGVELSLFDATFNTEGDITKYADEYVVPQIKTLADDLDAYCATKSLRLFNLGGTPGTTPGTDDAHGYLGLADVGQRMMENAVPMNMRKVCVLDPKGLYTLPNGLKGLFVREAQEGVTTGKIGHAVDFDFYGSNNILRVTAGTFNVANAVVNAANQSGSSITMSTADPGDTLVKGAIITFASCYAINPVNKERLASGRLQQFVVTEDCVADGAGAITVKISPPIVGPNLDGSKNPYQNVSALPALNDHITQTASRTNNFAFVEDTFTLVSVPLKGSGAAKINAPYSYEGVALLMTADYDINLRRDITRIDYVAGAREMWPETGCILAG